MKKILIVLASLIIVGSVFTGCAANQRETDTTNDQTLTPTSSMSEKVSEDLTDASEKISEALTDVSDDMQNDTTTTQPTTE